MFRRMAWLSLFTVNKFEKPMRLTIEIDNAASEALRKVSRDAVGEARRRMVDQGMQAALESTIRLNPVRTGRSRAAWSAALSQLEGDSRPAAVGDGPIAEGVARASAGRVETSMMTEARATNAVGYVPFLEYGTSRMSPFAMVRTSLAVVQRVVGQWFRLS